MTKLIVGLLTVFYISSSGSDWFSCYMATNKWFAKRTVAAAKQCLRPGDSIVVLN